MKNEHAMGKGNVLRRTRWDWVLEGIAAAGVVATIASLGFYGCFEEGEPFPVHFNAWGEVDGWGDRSMLWKVVCLEVALWVLLSIVERFYRIFNYPVRVTEENRGAVQRLGVRMIRVLKMMLALFIMYLQYATIGVALGWSGGLNEVVVVVSPALVVAVLLVFVWKMYACRGGKGGC